MADFSPPAVDEIEPFTPPAADEFDLSQVGTSPYDKYKLAISQGQVPEEYSKVALPPSLNPDYDFPRQAGVVPYIGKGLSEIQEHVIEPVAAQVLTQLKRSTSPDVPTLTDDQGKTVSGPDLSAVQPSQPLLRLPRLSLKEMEEATPGEKVAAGIGEGLAGAIEGFTTPGNIFTIPFAEAKPVQAYFGAQMAMGIPDSLKAITDAKTPDEIAKAYTSLTANLGMGALLAHSALKESAPRSPKGPGDVVPPPDIRATISQNDLLQQKAAAATTPQPQVKLNKEHSDLLAPHMGEDGKAVFSKLPEGRVMLADHENGQIVVDPEQFAKFVDNDLKGMSPKEKAAAVKSKFDHEDIHLKTDPEDAEPFWNSLSPFEQSILKRQYLKGHDASQFTPAQLGFEAIRNRMERAMGMTRDDFVGMALHERWTAKALDHLSNIVSKIRNLRDSELSAHQKGILDKVRDNLNAAKDAVAAGVGAGAGNQPFSLREDEKPEDDLTSPLPPMNPDERVVLVRRPDGSIYRAAFAGHTFDVSSVKALRDRFGKDKVESIARLVNGGWSHGMLAPGEKIIKGFSPYAAVERSGEPEGPAALRRNEEEDRVSKEFLSKGAWPKDLRSQASSLAPSFTEKQRQVLEEKRMANEASRRDGGPIPYPEAEGPAALRRTEVPESDPRREFYDFSYYEDRLQQPELLKGAISVGGKPDEGGVLAVPVGGARKSGSLGCGELYDKAQASEIANKLRGKKGFPDVRVTLMPRGYDEFPDMKYQVEWGAPIDWETGWDYLDGPNEHYHDRLGDQFGYHKEEDPRTATGKRLEDFKMGDHQGNQQSLFPDMPAALRKKGKAGEQEEFFAAVTKKGVPGGEDVQAASAAQMGAKEVPPEQKVFAQDVWFENPSESEGAQLPYRPISPSEAKSPEELKKILTSEARVGGSSLPVSMTRRLTALFDKRDGTVHLVSTYPGDGTVRLVDPALAGKERPSRPIEEITPNYEPFYSILLREPKQNFHQKFNSMRDFQEMFHTEAKEIGRQYGTGYSGIPQGGDITSVDAPGVRESDVQQKGLRLSTPFSFPGEKYELPRPTEAELKDFHGFFGDTPPSDAQQWARRIERTAATASRAMISGLRKLTRIIRAQHRGMSEGEALGQVLDQLYENYTKSETRSDFVQRTMAQSRPSTAEENAATTRRLLAQAEREKRSGARELSTARDRPPTVVAGAPQGIAPKPTEAITTTPPEMLSDEDRAKLDEEIEKDHNVMKLGRSMELMGSIVESPTPKERYRIAGRNKTIEQIIREPEVEEEEEGEETPSHTNLEIFPERDIESEAPKKPAGESLAQQKKVVAKAEGHKGQLDLFKKQGPSALRRVEELKEDTADAVSGVTAYVKRKASEQQLAATRDAVDAKYAVAGDQVDKAIRLVTADKKSPEGNKQVLKAAPTVVQAGAYTIDYPVPDELKGEVLAKMKEDPIYRNIENMFASEDPIDKAKGGQMLAKLKRETVLQMVDDGDIDWHTGTVKYNKRAEAKLEQFGNLLDKAEAKSKNIMDAKGGGLKGMLDRRAARARLKAVGDMREQLKYAQEHWNEPELQDTAAKMVVEMEAQHRNERDMGMKVKRAENYLPGRYEEQWFDGDRIQFMEGPRILGKSFRKPATFDNYYEAIAAGNYLPFNMDGAALVAHRVRQGMRQIETRLWENGLKTLNDPHSGMPMVASLRNGLSPSPEYVLHTFDGGRQMAVHKGSLDIIKAITGESIIQNSPATRRAMQMSQKLKHTILFGDTFHLGRLKAYDWSINGIGKGGYRGGLSILEYRPEDVPAAVARGLVRPEDAAWADGTIDVHLPKGDTQVTRRQIGNMFLQRGLNAGRIADAIFKVEGGFIGKYNKFLFDKFTRGLMMETAVKEFERMNRDNLKTSNGKATSRYDYRKIVDDITRDTNNYMGSIGRQGWIKSQTFQDFFRMFGLAPQWVEGLVKKETALPGRLSGLSYLAGRRNVPLLGTAGRGIARGLATMFAVTQAINLITRRQPTWKNEEEGHKWDAWIPDATGKGEGFFMSPLSLFNEVTHDIIRLTGNKPTVYDAVHQIGENKLGPYGRAAMIFATGETPDHRKITSTAGMAKEMGKALIPVPISLGKVAQAGAAAVGIGQPPAPGSVQRQAMASLGVKTEPAPTANAQIYKKADEFVKENGLNRSAGWQQVQTDELGYSDLRRSAAAGDKKGFNEALEKLRQTRTDDQIYKAMQLWNARTFTGSKAAEKYFVSGLTDKELDLYSRARVERQKTLTEFETLLVDDLTKKSAASK